MSNYIAKLRQSNRNRESYDEIMELESELRRAYIAKELQAQLLEKETERYIENVRKQQAANLMRLEQRVALENDVLQRSVDLKKSEDYRRELLEQIALKEEEKSLMEREAREERKILMEVDAIREHCETLETREKKDELAESMRRERLILQEMKQIRRCEEAEVEAQKYLEDQEYLKEIDQREERMKKFLEERIRSRERTMREIASMLMNIEAHRREKDELIVELMAEDVKYEILIKEEEEAIRRKRMREELAANLREQIAFTEECKLRFVEQDKAFAEEIMRKIMESERTSRLTTEAKRRMQLQYREDLDRLIDKRREIRREEISKMEKAARETDLLEKMNSYRVKEERKRLLRKHAPNVADFLSKEGLTEEEREVLNERE